MAKPKPAKKADAKAPAQESVYQVLPMSLRPGDRLADESGEWTVLGRPYSTGGGNGPCPSAAAGAVRRGWSGPGGAHEKVSVRRADRIE